MSARSKFPTIAIYANQAAAAAALSGMTAGTLVITTDGGGGAFFVKLAGTVKTLVPIDASGVLGPWATRGLSLTATPGAPASGQVTYRVDVINNDADPVPGALVFFSLGRSVGAGAGAITVVTGSLVSMLDTGGSNFAGVIQCNNAGVAEFRLTGTAGDTWSTTAATDAPTGGQSDQDAGRVLP